MSQLDQYEVCPIYGCHLWTGRVNDHGRPIVWRGNKPHSAIRAVFERDGIVIPPDHVPDHQCRRILCIRRSHLELVTKNVNELRKSWSYRCKRKQCVNGHDMSDAMVTPEGGRLCRTCNKENRDG